MSTAIAIYVDDFLVMNKQGHYGNYSRTGGGTVSSKRDRSPRVLPALGEIAITQVKLLVFKSMMTTNRPQKIYYHPTPTRSCMASGVGTV